MQKFIHNGLTVFRVLPAHQIAKVSCENYNFTALEEEQLEILIDTLRTAKEVLGIPSVGLAAPQVGWNKRLFLAADLSRATKTNLLRRIEIFINPTIFERSDQQELSEEVCLSIPKQKAYVYRHSHVALRYFNLLGQEVQVKATGMAAFIVQHEMDHLDGIDVLKRAQRIEQL